MRPSIPQQIHRIHEDMAKLGDLLNNSKYDPKDIMTRNFKLANTLKHHISRSLRGEHKESDSESEDDYTMVFIWDLDVITMMSRKRMEEVSQNLPGIDPLALHRMINDVLVTLGISNSDELLITNIEDDIPGQHLLSQMLYHLKNVYNEVLDEDSIISNELLEKCKMDIEDIEPCQSFSRVEGINTQRWESVRRSLDLVNRKSIESADFKYANVVLSNEGLAQSVGQLIISGCSSAVQIENVFSTFGMFKSLVMRSIEKKFGEKCCYIHITSPYDSPEATDNNVFSISANESIEVIYKVQQKYLQ